MEWVQPDNICDMMVISFKCFGNSIRGRALWRIDVSLCCGLCGERGTLRILRTLRGCRSRGICYISMFLFGLSVQTFLNPTL